MPTMLRAAEHLGYIPQNSSCFPCEAAPVAWAHPGEVSISPVGVGSLPGAAWDVQWRHHGMSSRDTAGTKDLGQCRQSRESWERGKSLWWHRKTNPVLIPQQGRGDPAPVLR